MLSRDQDQMYENIFIFRGSYSAEYLSYMYVLLFILCFRCVIFIIHLVMNHYLFCYLLKYVCICCLRCVVIMEHGAFYSIKLGREKGNCFLTIMIWLFIHPNFRTVYFIIVKSHFFNPCETLPTTLI